MPDNATSNNKRLAKNTLILYFRTIVILAISLYTSRVILQVLGVEDYGIYNVVGGVVALFAIISQTMIGATQRYLTFELGKKENNHSREIFSTALTIHISLALILLFLFETVGLWFVNNELNIATSRMVATNWIYQFSIITFTLHIIRIPFEASIIAHEKMSFFAYINMLEAILKLIILYLIPLCAFDLLVQYGCYILLIALLAFAFYFFYSKRHFSEISFVFVHDKSYYTNMFSFAGYNFLASASGVLTRQGLSIMLNIFFGVTVNAAKGIAEQVNGAVTKFVNDFMLALNPQITKAYAGGDINYTMSLVYRGSKFSFYLLLLLGLPVFIEAPFILSIWLNTVPEYTVVFVRWTIATAMLGTFANSVSTCGMASGDIKRLSIWSGSLRLLILPIAYVYLRNGMSVEYVFSISFFITFFLVFVRLQIVCNQVHVSPWIFIKDVIGKCLFIGTLTYSLGYAWHYLFFTTISFPKLIIEVLLITLTTILILIWLGLRTSERKLILDFIKVKIIR